MMNKFKIGDKVICINDGMKSTIKNGQTYTISKVYSQGDETFVLVNKDILSYYAYRFKKLCKCPICEPTCICS